VKNFESRLKGAKSARTKRFGTTLLLLVSLFVLFVSATAYINRVDIFLDFEGEETPGSINRISGLGFVLGSRLYRIFGETVISVKHLGYEEEVITANSSSPINYTVPLEFLSKQVRLSAATALTQVVWSIDGIPVGYTNPLEISLVPGEYEVGLQADGLENQIRLEKIEPNEIPDTLTFNAEYAESNVFISSVPAGADVAISGVYYGKTPVEFQVNTKGSKQLLELTLAGYQTVRESILAAGDDLSMSYTLEPVKSKRTLTLSPRGGTLIINGAVIDATTDVLNINLMDYQPNEISYSKFGYETSRVQIGTEEIIDISLLEITSEISFRSIPESDVYVDGISVGRTPLSMQIQVGPHEIKFSAEDYVEFTKNLEIDTSPSLISADLETLFAFRDRTSSQRYSNSQGIQLIKVNGTSLRMGSPRNEIGQRANEQIRNVTFQRKFYMSEAEISEEDYSKFDSSRAASDLPVTNISWLDAVEYCNWLSAAEGLEPFYVLTGNSVVQNVDSLGYRLPTEAEWEYVVKRNGKSRQSIFLWGDEYTITAEAGNIADKNSEGSAARSIASYDDGFQARAPIRSFPPADLFYDLSGNVSEFVSDHYSLTGTPEGESSDFINLAPSQQRLVKGSNYLSSSWTELRASFREPLVLNEARPDVGFRIARYIN